MEEDDMEEYVPEGEDRVDQPAKDVDLLYKRYLELRAEGKLVVHEPDDTVRGV